MNAGGLFGNLLGAGVLAIVLSCVFFLVSLFLIAPLPYIISAAILKIPNRNYWKAFGSAILGGLAGAAVTAVVTGIMIAITGSNINSVFSKGILGLMGSLIFIGVLVGWAGSIVVEMAITGGLYQVGFGKGALIWLLALVFGFLIGVVITLILFVISFAAGASLFNNIQKLIQGGGFQLYLPQLLSLI